LLIKKRLTGDRVGTRPTRQLIGERAGTRPTCGDYARILIEFLRQKVKVVCDFGTGSKFAMGVGVVAA